MFEAAVDGFGRATCGFGGSSELSVGGDLDAGELALAPAASVLVVPHMLIDPNTRTPAKRAESSDAACRHGLIWDHTLFHAVPNW